MDKPRARLLGALCLNSPFSMDKPQARLLGALCLNTPFRMDKRQVRLLGARLQSRADSRRRST
eukprot:364769-Chlamydomonas_euryale.AAC.5